MKVSVPGVNLTWSPKTKTVVTTPLKANPTVIVRSHNGQDYQYLDIVEENLTSIGWRVVDRKAQLTNPDYIVEVGWLHFSDPDMWGTLDEDKITFSGSFSATGNGNYTNTILCIAFPSQEKRNKYLASDRSIKSQKKYDGVDLYLPVVFTDDWGNMTEEMRQEIIESESFRVNKNVVSAMFKIIDAKSGTIAASLTIGELNTPSFRFPAGRSLTIFWDPLTSGYRSRASVYKLANRELKVEKNINWSDWANERLLTELCPIDMPAATCCYLDYISASSNTGEIPFAAKLSAGEDVKINDEQVTSLSKSRSTTNGNSYGHGGTNYYRYFNRSYYSGRSNSQTDSNTSETTTYKEAEWLRCSDFHGYYRPLSKRMAEELAKLR